MTLGHYQFVLTSNGEICEPRVRYVRGCGCEWRVRVRVAVSGRAPNVSELSHCARSTVTEPAPR